MTNIFPEGKVYCGVCGKPLIDEDDRERGYHLHCEKSKVFCEDEKR